MPFFVKGASNVGSMDILIKYDPKVLKATKIKNGDLTKEAFFESNIEKEGQVKIAMADTLGMNGDGILVNVTFEVIGVGGSSSKIGFSALAYNSDTLVDIIVNSQTGTISIPPKESPLKGKTKYLIPLFLFAAVVFILWKYN